MLGLVLCRAGLYFSSTFPVFMKSNLEITDRCVSSVSWGSIYLFSLSLVIQSQSTVFVEMGKDLSSCTGNSELMYRFSKGLRSCGFRWAEENLSHLLRKAWGRWDPSCSLSEANM